MRHISRLQALRRGLCASDAAPTPCPSSKTPSITKASAFVSPNAIKSTGPPPPLGTVHRIRQDGSWEAAPQREPASPVKPGPTFEELQSAMDARALGADTSWAPLDVDISELTTLFERCSAPMRAVAEGTIPAIITARAALSGVSSLRECGIGRGPRSVALLIEKGLIRPSSSYDVASHDPDAHTVSVNRPYGYGNGTDTRIDVGSSLVNMNRGALARHTPSTRGGSAADDAANKEEFLKHSASTLHLFDELFGNDDSPTADPIATFFDTLGAVASHEGHQVMVGTEPESGRRYGPAIFRVHYESWAYAPHINHVRLGDELYNFEASRFVHQFAGLINFQNAERSHAYGGKAPGATIYRTFPTPGIEAAQQAGTLPLYATANGIATATLDIHEGDFYLFNSGLIHEVPAVTGEAPRIVLATFIGYSPHDEEVFVWA